MRLLLGATLINRRTGHRRVKIVSLKPNHHLAQLNALFEAGKLLPVIDRVYPFDEISRAMCRFCSGRHAGRVVVRVA